MIALLLVSVLAVGGPRHHAPSRLANAHIQVWHHGKLVASGSGALRLHLRHRRYLVEATILGQPCEVRYVIPAREHVISLRCSIP